jgi:hypothetical protein
LLEQQAILNDQQKQEPLITSTRSVDNYQAYELKLREADEARLEAEQQLNELKMQNSRLKDRLVKADQRTRKYT